MTSEHVKTVRQYFLKTKQFIVPNYQRGYKWGVPGKEGTCAVSILMDNLIAAAPHKTEYYLQGVTVYEDNADVYLIDGQQRTTTLFILLNVLGEKDLIAQGNTIKLKYDIRTDSHNFLHQMVGLPSGSVQDEDVQDIYYFKQADKTIRKKLEVVDREAFKEFLLDRVNLIYIPIAKDKATRAFEMLNGQKAFMKAEDLIKAELLSKGSRPAEETRLVAGADPSETASLEWEINALRSKYAREWDKWLYWWNRKEVKSFFKTEGAPMGLLLEYYFRIHNPNGKEYLQNKKEAAETFELFRQTFLNGVRQAKVAFKGIRDLQKCFEDLFHSVRLYNVLGLALATYNYDTRTRYDIIRYFIDKRDNLAALEQYARRALVDCTHIEILEENEDAFVIKTAAARRRLEGKWVFKREDNSDGGGKGDAYRQLLRMNVLELGTRHKFDFTVFDDRSLEHINPQNPRDELGESCQDDIQQHSEGIHSIGNLCLLNSSLNSKLSNRPFAEKKFVLFDHIKHGFLLPHTLIVFSKAYSTLKNDAEEVGAGKEQRKVLTDEWNAGDVKSNAAYFFQNFDNYYDA